MTSRRRLCITPAAILPLLIGLLAMGRPANAQEVRAHARTDSVSVGERFDLVVTAQRPVWARTVFPTPPPDSTGEMLQVGDVLLLRKVFDNSPQQEIESGLDSVLYEATTFALDTALVGPIPVSIVSEGDTFTVATAPLLIPVRSVVPPDAEDILDLMPIAEFPRPVWPWVAFVAVLILATALFLFWYRRSPGIINLIRDDQPVLQTPIEEANARFDRLAGAHLDTDPARKAFFVELSEALRTYLSRRLNVPALERTSREVMRDLERLSERNDVPADIIGPVKQILETSDLAKFAEIFPRPDGCHDLLESASGAVTRIEAFLTPEAETIDDEIESDVVESPGPITEDT